MNDQIIKDGLDEAYRTAGENAYFGNGFMAGVAFANENSPWCRECRESDCLVSEDGICLALRIYLKTDTPEEGA